MRAKFINEVQRFKKPESEEDFKKKLGVGLIFKMKKYYSELLNIWWDSIELDENDFTIHAETTEQIDPQHFRNSTGKPFHEWSLMNVDRDFLRTIYVIIDFNKNIAVVKFYIDNPDINNWNWSQSYNLKIDDDLIDNIEQLWDTFDIYDAAESAWKKVNI